MDKKSIWNDWTSQEIMTSFGDTNRNKLDVAISGNSDAPFGIIVGKELEDGQDI